MKCIIIFFIFISILISTSNAQIVSDFGIKIGLVSSKFEMDLKNFSEDILIINNYKKHRVGPNTGIYLRYINWKYLNFETELSYIQKGAKFKQDGLPINIPQELRLDYIQFKNSVVPKIDMSRFEIYSILGLSLDYLLSVKGGNLAHSEYKKYVAGYILGIGFKTEFVFNNKIFLELVFNRDINEIYESRWARYYNNLVSLNLGFSFKNIL